MVLERLCSIGLYTKLKKYVFHQSQVEFLRHIISREVLSMNPKKIEAILGWKKSTIVRDIQCFLKFANFYCIVIKNYSKIATLLTKLTSKDKLEWDAEVDQAFDTLKMAFIMAPILIHSDFQKAFFFESDAFNFVLKAVLS